MEISPRDPRRELRPQGQAVAAPIGKGVHFLRNNVSRFAQRAGKDCRSLKHRYFYPREAVKPPYAIKSRHHMSEARLRFARSEEHTSELQSLMRISYAVFCLKNKKKTPTLKKAQEHPKNNQNK